MKLVETLATSKLRRRKNISNKNMNMKVIGNKGSQRLKSLGNHRVQMLSTDFTIRI